MYLRLCTICVLGARQGGKPLCGRWDSNLGLSQQEVPLATEPTLQPSIFIYLFFFFLSAF